MIPERVDRSRWSPSEDRKGRPVQPGDYVSVPTYPKGTARGVLVASERSWAVLPDGSEVLALVVQTDNGTQYEATSKILKMSPPKKSNPVLHEIFTSPLERDARLIIYMGGFEEGDPTWFPLKKGHVPVDVVRKFVHQTHPGVLLIPVTSTATNARFTFLFVNRQDQQDEMPVDVELELKHPRRRSKLKTKLKRKLLR